MPSPRAASMVARTPPIGEHEAAASGKARTGRPWTSGVTAGSGVSSSASKVSSVSCRCLSVRNRSFSANAALGIANLHQTMSPNHYVLCGDVVGGGAILRDAIAEHVRAMVPAQPGHALHFRRQV